MTRFYLQLMTAATALITLCFSLSAQEKLIPGEGDVEVFYDSGNQFGVWHPASREFELTAVRKSGSRAGKHYVFTFKDDGSVVSDLGAVVGSVSKSGQMSHTQGGLTNVSVSTRYILYKRAEIGQINDLGAVYVYGKRAYYCSAPMDKNVLCFVAICAKFDDDLLAQYKKARDTRSQQATTKTPKPTGGRNATKLEIVGSDVKACDAKGVWIGSAKMESDGRISIYSAKSTVPVGVLSDGHIEFRGFTNYLSYSYTETTDTYTFNSEKGLPIVDVEHNSGSRSYEVRDRASRKLINTFPDTIDGRFGAMLIFGFFDK